MAVRWLLVLLGGLRVGAVCLSGCMGHFDMVVMVVNSYNIYIEMALQPLKHTATTLQPPNNTKNPATTLQYTSNNPATT